jgi:N-glycosylase/DNA lyase
MEHNMEEKSVNDQIADAYNEYVEENTRFTDKGVKVSAARARKALGELRKLAGERRKQIQTEKEALASK